MIFSSRNRWFVLFVFMIAHGINDGFGWIIPPLLPTIGFIYTLRMSIASLSPVAVGFASEKFSLYHSFFILAFAGGLAAVLLLPVMEKPAD